MENELGVSTAVLIVKIVTKSEYFIIVSAVIRNNYTKMVVCSKITKFTKTNYKQRVSEKYIYSNN